MAVFSPMPSARVRTTTAEKPGRASSGRTAERRRERSTGADTSTDVPAARRFPRAPEATNASRSGKTRPGSGQHAVGSMEMGMEKYGRARELMAKAGGDFAGPKPESLVARAEAALGLRFPPSYRQF